MRGKCSPLAGPWESLHRQNKGTTVQFYRGVPPLVRMKSLLTGPPHSRIIQVKDVKIMLDEKDYKEIAHLFKVIIENDVDPKLKALAEDYESLRKVAQYASKLWIDENGGELLDKTRQKAKRTRSKDIRGYCLWCQNGNVPEVRKCQDKTCPLWRYRMGYEDADAEGARQTRGKAIKERCLDCSGWIREEIKKCPFADCPLYEYRS